MSGSAPAELEPTGLDETCKVRSVSVVQEKTRNDDYTPGFKGLKERRSRHSKG